MSTLTFTDTHNMVVFLEKPTKSDGFHEIIDFLNANQIRYALTVNPTIYTSCIEQFWATTKVKTVNGECQLQALVDKKKVILIETSIRSDLHLEDSCGIDCLPTATIFEELARIGLYKVGVTRRVASSDDEGLGAQEDASKQERSKTEVIDIDTEVTLVDESQEMNDYNLMFDTYVLEEQEKDVAKKDVSTADPVTTGGKVVTTINVEVNTAKAPKTNIDELTLAQNLIEIKAAKPKAVTSAATITTTIRPKARGVVVQEPSEFKTTSSSLQASQLPQAKDKDKRIMVEPKVLLKKKDQLALDEEMARNLKAQL
ncbi:hypothetical protein Tco_1515630 [Tanacetum coccineum]